MPEGRPDATPAGPVFRVGAAAFPVAARAAATLAAHPDAVLGVRAEHVRPGESGAEAQVAVVQPLGPVTHVSATWAGGSLTASLTAARSREPVRLSLDPAGLLFLDRATGALLETGS